MLFVYINHFVIFRNFFNCCKHRNNMNKKITLIRHGEAQTNIMQIHNSDPAIKYSLTQKGIEQAQEVAIKLKNLPIDCIYTSQIYRAKETAKIINRHHNLELVEDERINEKKSGIEGESIHNYFKLEENVEDKMNFKINNGETWNELIQRVYLFLDEIITSYYSNIVIVSHGDPLIVMIQYFTKEDIFLIEMPRNCEIREFEI